MRVSIFQFSADVVQVLHFVIPCFFFFGIFATALGTVGRAKVWMTSFRWRSVHLAIVLLLVLQARFGMPCPLTTFEKYLRRSAGLDVYAGGYMELVMDRIWGTTSISLPLWLSWGLKAAGCLTLVIGWWKFPPPLPQRLRASWRFARLNRRDACREAELPTADPAAADSPAPEGGR